MARAAAQGLRTPGNSKSTCRQRPQPAGTPCMAMRRATDTCRRKLCLCAASGRPHLECTVVMWTLDAVIVAPAPMTRLVSFKRQGRPGPQELCQLAANLLANDTTAVAARDHLREKVPRAPPLLCAPTETPGRAATSKVPPRDKPLQRCTQLKTPKGGPADKSQGFETTHDARLGCHSHTST